MNNITIKIISTGWRCEQYYQRCIESVLSQKCIGAMVMMSIVIDESVGGYPYLDTFFKSKSKIPIRFIKKSNRMGKVFNFIQAVKNTNPQPEDILCDVDLDDYLEPGALQRVATEYRKKNDLLLTYGSYRMESGRPARFNGFYTTESYRTSPWYATHLKTFKYKLFSRIANGDLFGRDGKFLQICADVAMMFPMLEMAGLSRIKHIPQVLYCYNDLNPLNDHKIPGNEQKLTEIWLRGRPVRYYKLLDI
jgi:glycosyltransferase involved in cell wall biosynthesis